MSLSSKETAVVVKALKRHLVPGMVRKVVSCVEPGRIALLIRTPGKNHYCLIQVAQSVSFIGRTAAKPVNTPIPSEYVMLLRKHLEGARLCDISQVGDDRVVALAFERSDGQRTLMCELTDRHGNIFLLDGDGRIAGSIFANKSKRRPLVVREPYVAVASVERIKDDKHRFDATSDVDTVVAELYLAKTEQVATELLRTGMARVLKQQLKRTQRLQQKISADLDNARRAEQLFANAYVLQANLKRVRRGQMTLDTSDFEGNRVQIALDPALGPVENMERMFQKASRLQGAIDQIETRYLAADESIDGLRATLQQVAKADFESLQQLQVELRKQYPAMASSATAGKRQQSTRLPFKEYSIAGNTVARVGRGARDNDALIRSYAASGDLWLHARQVAGSHVIVPLPRGKDPSPETLVEAAHLAAHFSKACNEEVTEVIYTRRRYVQKPKGAPPGLVKLIKEKTIVLRKDAAILKRLLKAGR